MLDIESADDAVMAISCGCADTSTLKPILRAALEIMDTAYVIALSDRGGTDWRYSYLFDKLFHIFGATDAEPFTPYFYVFMGALQNQNWIEHGSGIRYSWLTEKGREVLQMMRDEAVTEKPDEY